MPGVVGFPFNKWAPMHTLTAISHPLVMLSTTVVTELPNKVVGPSGGHVAQVFSCVSYEFPGFKCSPIASFLVTGHY